MCTVKKSQAQVICFDLTVVAKAICEDYASPNKAVLGPAIKIYFT